MADEGWQTAAEMAQLIGATEYSVSQAILNMGMKDSGKRDMSDRRRFIYPPGMLEKVRKWLETH